MDFVECCECKFVFVKGSTTSPKPKGRKSCPNCDSEDFDFIGQ